jgi:2-polyprenyl-6-methoxyphenol hydroxylase-like FAD-dependent oxidoreductase
MAHILVVGAGMNGLSTAMLLARDGHEVTVVERDPAESAAADAWEGWERRGVNQFRLPHLMLPCWTGLMRRELPDVLDELKSVGALTVNALGLLPESRRGPLREEDERFVTVTARRPVLESAVAAVAVATPGVTIRRGVAVTGLAAEGGTASGVPWVRGVLTEGGGTLRADLVVDCGGRRSALGAWLAAAGARPPVEEREDCGFVYFGRHFRPRPGGEPPVPVSNLVQNYDSVTLLTLPSDNGTWSVTFAVSARDRELRALRDEAVFDAALARYPWAAHWRDGEPISGMDVMAGIEDRFRRFTVDGRPVAAGVVALGDAWACTNPSLGRGASMGLMHACLLRDTLREVGAGDPDAFAALFHERTAATIEPLYRGTLWYDRHRLAEIDADVAGEPYRTDDPRWAAGKALFAASLADPELARAYQDIGAFLKPPDQVFAEPGVLERAMALGAGAPPYPSPGPGRRELLAAISHNGG